ncbi:JAB domain-containing protein [Wolbachia endosymbiont of Folsomia candida]|uniref:JAB domain-containing protein n=1 Tax=Wolbachia endosymbiont of Folsomia candida TaxID=169402 RepID=UPI000A9D8EF3|nr:JAB domain-containing protein [Wolbachia endosymbiont of Folsomia candida]APR98605.1 DNA repair protein RadC [Wolbachia endosymbiont of Folsomia candida]
MNNNRKNEREKLETIVLLGKDGIEDHELLGLAICSGNRLAKSIAIAEKLIHFFGGIGGAINSDYHQLLSIDSEMTDSMVARIFCIKEILARILRGKLKELPIIDNEVKLRDYLKFTIGQSRKEHLRVMYLNQSYHLIHEYVQDSGTTDRTPIYIREIIERGLFIGSTSIIVAHNHPNGDLTPTKEDIASTLDLVLTCTKLGIEFVDHVIVTETGYFSFKENKLF